MSTNKLIIALDYDHPDKAIKLIHQLGDSVNHYKVGLELFNSAGPEIIHKIKDLGKKIFYDAKFHDIPNTVAGAISQVAQMGIWMVNIHCFGGREMMLAAKKAAIDKAKELNQTAPLIIGVTLLTSIDDNILHNELGIESSTQSIVLGYAQLAKKAGLDGIVCSGDDIELIRKEIGKDFILVVPGIRPSWSISPMDQKRVITPLKAIDHGADYIVIGRPITQSKEPVKSLQKIIDEIG